MFSYLTLALLFVSTLTQAEDDNVQKGICNTFNVFKKNLNIFFQLPGTIPSLEFHTILGERDQKPIGF